jgi:hypothetical protein
VTSWLAGICDYRVSENCIYIRFGDVRSEWLLIPLDTPEDQARLLSMQITGGWLSEAIEMDVGLISPLAGRCGRYPGANLGGATWFGLLADTNLPSEGSDWHKFMALDTPPDWQIFRQPSGMSEDAENLEWLTQTPETLKLPFDDPRRRAQGRTYYERFIRSNTEAWCQRYVYAEFGDDPSGSAVFGASFKLSWHAVDDLEPVHGHPIIVGQDFGRDPCSVLCQVDHKGRLLVLQEVIAEDMGLELQLTRGLKPALMHERYLGKPVAVVGDPAGRQRSTTYEETSFDVIKRHGLMAYPAPTNDIDARLRSVEAYLLQARDAGPAFLIDKTRCPTLVRALAGGYRFARTKQGQRKPNPDKNKYSHIADALQYACLAAHGNMTGMIASRLARPAVVQGQRLSAAAWT